MEDITWIKIYRKFLKWEWYDDINACRLFIHILLKANYKDQKWHGEMVKRGSFVTSYQHLSKETGLTIKKTRIALTKLIETGEVAKLSTSQFTVISVNNYDKYQTGASKGANEGQTKGKRRATTKERKKDINISKDTRDSSLKVLKEPEFWEELSLKFNTNRSYIEQECEKMEDWLRSKGKRQRDYKAFARNWIRRATESQRKEYDTDRAKIDRGLQSTQDLLKQYKK